MILQDLPTLKCSEQTSVPVAIVYSLPSSQWIPWIHYFPVDADVGQFLFLLLAFKNTKTSRHSKIKQTRPSTKQKLFRGSIIKTKHRGLTSLTFMQLIPAMTEWSAIFAFGLLSTWMQKSACCVQRSGCCLEVVIIGDLTVYTVFCTDVMLCHCHIFVSGILVRWWTEKEKDGRYNLKVLVSLLIPGKQMEEKCYDQA